MIFSTLFWTLVPPLTLPRFFRFASAARKTKKRLKSCISVIKIWATIVRFDCKHIFALEKAKTNSMQRWRNDSTISRKNIFAQHFFLDFLMFRPARGISSFRCFWLFQTISTDCLILQRWDFVSSEKFFFNLLILSIIIIFYKNNNF